jgi:type II secretory pathway pseudopilin PulG|tara:strand:+ start:2127 stop:2348 length:222 start_codon:yes stop_codon:yes gene_type:complete
MRWLLPLAQVLALLIESWQQWRERKRDQQRQEQHEQIDSDTDAALRDRGWLHDSDREGADVPDQPEAEHRNDD